MREALGDAAVASGPVLGPEKPPSIVISAPPVSASATEAEERERKQKSASALVSALSAGLQARLAGLEKKLPMAEVEASPLAALVVELRVRLRDFEAGEVPADFTANKLQALAVRLDKILEQADSRGAAPSTPPSSSSVPAAPSAAPAPVPAPPARPTAGMLPLHPCRTAAAAKHRASPLLTAYYDCHPRKTPVFDS